MTLHDSHSEPAQERRHIHSVRDLRGFYDGVNAGPVSLDGVDPVVVDILIPPPAVHESASTRQALGVGVKVPVLVDKGDRRR